MAQQEILGGSGVYWGDEKVKINANFTELYAHLAEDDAHGTGLPAMAGNAGYYLETDGGSACWSPVRERLEWVVDGLSCL